MGIIFSTRRYSIDFGLKSKRGFASCGLTTALVVCSVPSFTFKRKVYHRQIYLCNNSVFEKRVHILRNKDLVVYTVFYFLPLRSRTEQFFRRIG